MSTPQSGTVKVRAKNFRPGDVLYGSTVSGVIGLVRGGVSVQFEGEPQPRRINGRYLFEVQRETPAVCESCGDLVSLHKNGRCVRAIGAVQCRCRKSF